MNTYIRLIGALIFLLLNFTNIAYSGGVEEIPPPVAGDMSSDSTKVFVWEAQEPVATIVFVQGGTGRLALRTDQKNLNHPFYQMLRRLAETKTGNGKINIVVFDSPWTLGDVSNPGMRRASNHLKRIEDVVKFYKEKFKLPVWVMGHSNGGISITSFIEYLQENNSVRLIQGAILSNSNNYISFKPPLNLPILFVQHEYDSCAETGASSKVAIYEDLKKINQSVTELAMISSGGSAGDCKSGAHMYSDSELDAQNIIRRFILKNNAPKN
jgi:hypothetical protein